MKTIFVALLMTSGLVVATETNKLYLTDDGNLKENRIVRLKEAQNSREALPAEDFPEGNWGSVQHGFQLSLRLDKQMYSLGEPIMATMLLRNVTNSVVTFLSPVYYGSDNGPLSLTVADTSNQPVQLAVTNTPWAVSGRVDHIGPGTQKKFGERLDGKFKLQTNATYFVTAHCALPLADRSGIHSSKVKVKITSNPTNQGSPPAANSK